MQMQAGRPLAAQAGSLCSDPCRRSPPLITGNSSSTAPRAAPSSRTIRNCPRAPAPSRTASRGDPLRRHSRADAYCIQSRLAVRLSEPGQHELAAKHYEKALALMPDSFGRVESHGFGCEGAFGVTEAQSAAERTGETPYGAARSATNSRVNSPSLTLK